MSEITKVEWHLTPRGWECGHFDPPADRVLTMHCEESIVTMNCREAWSSGSREQINSLIEQFGHGPQRNGAGKQG